MAHVAQAANPNPTIPGVNVDATGTALISAGSVTTISYTGITVGSGSNRGLIAMISLFGSSSTSPTAVWDSGGTNQSMTLLTTAGIATSKAWAFGLRNPTAGNKTLTFSWTTAGQGIAAVAVSFTGVNQTSDALAFPSWNNNSGTGTALSQAVASASGHIVIGQMIDGNSGNTLTGGQTLIYFDNTLATSTTLAEYTAGAASVTLTATASASSNWCTTGGDVST
jgi:hypothetical protein